MSQLLCTVKPGNGVSGVVAAVNQVLLDEPCLGLAEVNLQPPGGGETHRYQVLEVVRNGRRATLMRDLGLASGYTIHQFRVPGSIEDGQGKVEILHTVGELYDIADYLRNGYSQPPDFTPGDMGTDLMLQKEELARCRRRSSTFARSVKIQRS